MYMYGISIECYLLFVCRCSLWWDYVAMETFSDHDWIQNFRMRKETFLYICDQLRPFIQHEDTQLRKAVCVEKRLAITLWCLATPSEYRTIGHLFGVAWCTVCIIVHETVEAIVKKYTSISLPIMHLLR